MAAEDIGTLDRQGPRREGPLGPLLGPLLALLLALPLGPLLALPLAVIVGESG